MTAAPLIELRNISKHFAGAHALTDVSIAVEPGARCCAFSATTARANQR